MIAPFSSPVVADIPVRVKPGWSFHVVTAAAWSIFVWFHAVAALYFGVSAHSYWNLRDSGVCQHLAVHRIGMDSQHYAAIAVAYGAVTAVNLSFLLQMVVESVRHRRFVFDTRFCVGSASQNRNPIRVGIRAILLMYRAIFSPTGLLGVSGPCFDLLLLLREVLETALQTNQAYRMSQHLARAWLTRSYVSMLVLNCWFIAAVHTLLHRLPTTRYFMTLLCDLMLDVMSSIGVPVVLAALYARDADTNTPSIFGLKWYEDEWIVNAKNEFQLLLVVSWVDLASRMAFSLSMVSTLNTLKWFLDQVTDPRRKQGWRQRWSSIVPEASSFSRHLDAKHAPAVFRMLARANLVAKNSLLIKLQRVTFAAWGAVILALHLSSEMAQDVPECVMQVRPWGVSRPSCNLVLINCYREGIIGHASEIHERLDALHPLSMTALLIRHCPSLEMPPIIQSFSCLSSIKIYNSTIEKWENDAAVTKTSHPFFSKISLVRVRLIDGQIPPGLQAEDSPPTLNIFGFIHTNIHSIPDDLDSKLSPRCSIHFDTTQLEEVPSVLLRLQPKILELAGNPIHEVPSELFRLAGTEYIGLGYTSITALPDNVPTPSSALTSFNFDGTNISSFLPWVDAWLTFPGGTLYPERISASHSRYCAERDRIFAGELSAFSSPTDSRLMDASAANWGYMRRGVVCAPTTMLRYPVWIDDMFGSVP